MVPTCLVVGAMVAGSLFTGCKPQQKVVVGTYGPPVGVNRINTIISNNPNGKPTTQPAQPQTSKPQSSEPDDSIPPIIEDVYGPPVEDVPFDVEP